MPDSDQLRKRASRLFAMALKARETGFASAPELEKLASESLAQAEDMEVPRQHPADARGASAQEEIGPRVSIHTSFDARLRYVR
jgi:hypothetical protein